jgi:hypothetical protein
MRTTIKEARKLLKQLKNKYPKNDCQITISFDTWSKEHLTAYVSDYASGVSTTMRYDDADEVRNTYGL